jgi:ankyrin repeat protein
MLTSALAAKHCKTCDQSKPIGHFNKSAASKDGFAPSCRACANKARRERDKKRTTNRPLNIQTQLRAAVKKGDIKGLEKALKKTTDIALNQLLDVALTPFHSYPKKGEHLHIVRLLLTLGADANSRSSWLAEPILCTAAKSGRPDLVAALLDNRAKPDFYTASALGDKAYVKARLEEIQAVAWLLNNGASVAARTLDGRMPLHLAADRNNDTKVVEQLLEASADINARDDVGNTPLFYAKQSDKHQIIAYLQKRGASL